MQYPTLFACLTLLPMVIHAQDATLNPLEQEFKQALTGATKEGQSTRDGKVGVQPDKYVIDKVEKTGGDSWTFHVKVTFGGREMVIPFPLEVKWAGDTPVLTVTDKGYPGMGTYTARVVVYKGHYAGTWFGKNGGGKVFGTITSPKTALTPGRWVGTIDYAGGLRVPFSLDMKPGPAAEFQNGEERTGSTAGTWDGETLRLEFAGGGGPLVAKLANGVLKGKFGEQAIEFAPYCTCAYEGEAGPDISGKWQLNRQGGTLAVVRQGEDTWATLEGGVAAAGTHVGRFDGLQFTLAHFDGAHASLLEVEPQKDGALAVRVKLPGRAVENYRAAAVAASR